MKGLRGFAVGLCGVLCVAGLIVGTVYIYSSRVIFNSTMFSNRLAESMTRPEVSRIVAGEITDGIVASYRDLTPYRPILLGAVQYVVSSTPFRAVVRRAAKEAHETLLSQTGRDITLSVSDLGVIVQNALSMYPQIAEKIPARVQVALTVVEHSKLSDKIASLLRIGQRMRLRAAVLLGAGLALGACGLLLTRTKQRYLLRFGIGLAIVSFIVAGVAYFGGYAAAVLARTPVGADLIRGLWPVFIGPLALRMLILGGLGLVLIAAVTSLLEKNYLQTLVLAAWTRSVKRGLSPGWEIFRGLALIAAGIIAAFHPAQTLALLAVVGGGALFFEGMRMVFMTVARLTPRVEQALSVLDKKKRSVSPAIVVGAALVVIAGAGAFLLMRQGNETGAAASIDACNGYPELCDRRLNQVAFPTTHNSMSSADVPNWMFPNQERGIRQQLEDGVRGLLIDVHYAVPAGDRVKTLLDNEENARKKYEAALGKEGIAAAMRIRDRLVGEKEGERDIYMCHGFCELGDTRFITALEEIRDFLIANPNEVLIIIIQDEGVAPADVAACFAKSGLEQFVYRGSVKPPWPTLRELVESDGRVLVFAENNAAGVPWYHQAFEVFQETPYEFKDPSEFSNAPNRGGTGGSLLLMNNWIETAPAPLPSNASLVNAYDALLKRALACKRERHMMPNLIAVDFYRTGDLFRVVRTLNGINEPVPAPTP